MKISVLFIMLTMSLLILISCNKTIIEKEISEVGNLNNAAAEKTKSSGNIFEESVVLLQSIKPINTPNSAGFVEVVMILELLTFDKSVSLLSEYYIDSIQYSDDGRYNDMIAGDNIFTSIQVFEVDSISLDRYADIIVVHKSDNFIYESDLDLFLQDLSDLRAPTIKFGCDVNLVECPETNWWNSCWPFSSPCTCVEFTNCYFEITL